MKKLPRLTALAAVSVLVLGSTACITVKASPKDDNGNDSSEEDQTEDEDSALEALVGVWEA